MSLYLTLIILLISTVSLSQGVVWLHNTRTLLPSKTHKFFILAYILPTVLISSILAYYNNFEMSISLIMGSVILSTALVGIMSVFSLPINKTNFLKQIGLGFVSASIISFIIFKDFFNYLFTFKTLPTEEKDKFLTAFKGTELDKLPFGDLYISQGIVFLLIFLMIASSLFYIKKTQEKNNHDIQDKNNLSFSLILEKLKEKFNSKNIKATGRQLIKPFFGLLLVIAGAKLVTDMTVNLSPQLLSSWKLTDRVIGLTGLALISNIALITYSINQVISKKVENLASQLIQVSVSSLLISFGVVSLVIRIGIFKNQMLDFVDLIGMFVVLFLVTIFSKNNKINRVQGVIITASYVLYIIYLFSGYQKI